MISTKRLEGQTVFISGASSGIGEACARQYAACKCNLVLGARRVEKLQELKDSLEKEHGVTVHIGSVDVQSNDSIVKFISDIPEKLKEIDILVNNAGLALGVANTWENELDTIERVIDTNVKGLLYVCRLIIPGMVERKRGYIINISSIAGLDGYKGGSVYCASKHAVEAITTALRKELVNTPIRVTSICPGLVETEFSIVRFGGDENKAKKVYDTLPAGPLTADDIADHCIYCTSRPLNVQITQLVVMTNNQASAEVIHRE
mmetsp:Transcript_27595/g.69170  ORF Transcript_27595/g.69170 Transcript_27595/m.69170 type:complete len:262 (-) Transcript_27595:155-940(-)